MVSIEDKADSVMTVLNWRRALSKRLLITATASSMRHGVETASRGRRPRRESLHRTIMFCFSTTRLAVSALSANTSSTTALKLKPLSENDPLWIGSTIEESA
ncbi:MAG: hypothetical protein U0694_17255 [Anaerolineae bacterium]